MTNRTILLSACMAITLTASATQWQVGSGQTYTTPSQVSTLVGNGDTVNIAAGVYPSDVARWQANDLLLRGMGGMAHLESNGNAWGGKAIWVIQGDRTTVENIEFSECSVPDNNGAGIRQEGHHLTVLHCYFHDNENGILAGDVNPSTIRIEHTEFDHNGFGDGFSHNLYINHVDSLIFRYNYSHHAHVGHELKSRAQVNVIEYNRFSNEATGDASREIDLPNGGTAYLIGNVVQQGPQGQNSNMVGYGLEGLTNITPHELYAINNTLVNEKTVGSFFSVASAAYFKAYSNILAGGGNFMAGAWPASIDTLTNLRSTIAAVQFDSPANYDYHITTASPAHQFGFPAGVANSSYPLVAWDEYVHPVSNSTRCQHATLDAGAFETCTTGIAPDRSATRITVWPNPAHEVVYVADVVPTALVRVYGPTGQLVALPLTQQGNRIELRTTALPSGLYFLRIDERSFPFVIE
ncbi:MAG: T9SS type A sorting domain-containing protein [Flavobacteriales bacterium]|nr:T9SS type A sorting domain-containing protein [Flavobacteriales bacterium]